MALSVFIIPILFPYLWRTMTWITGNLHRHFIFLVICLFVSFWSFLCKKESTGLIPTSAELSVWALNVCLRASAAVNLCIIAVLAMVHYKTSQWFIPTFKHNTGIRNGNLPVMSKNINIFPHNFPWSLPHMWANYLTENYERFSKKETDKLLGKHF